MNTFSKVDRATFLRFAAAHPEQRFELERGRIVQQMTGGTRRHGLVAQRIARAIQEQIDLKAWGVLSDRGVGVGTSTRYPDVVVEPNDEPLESLETERPVLIVEVLSPSTTGTDLNIKPDEYLSIPSLDAYVVASQDEAAMLVWSRNKDGSFPEAGREVSGQGQSVVITGRSVQIALQLDSIYDGLKASATDEGTE